MVTDSRLFSIPERIKQLEQEIDMLYWKSDYPCTKKVSVKKVELDRLTEKSLQGSLYEANF